MDRSSTEAAFASVDIAQPSFEWSSGDRLLRVRRPGGFDYATGSTLSVTARSYRFSVAASATDKAGNRLQQSVAASFSTLRRITSRAGHATGWSGSVGRPDVLILEDDYASAYCSPDEEGRAFISFDISGLPANITNLEQVEMTLADNLEVVPGALPRTPNVPAEATHFRFTTTDPPTVFGVAGTVLGNLSRNGASSRLSNPALRIALSDDYQNRLARSNRSQYRVRLEPQCPGRAAIVWDPTASSLLITYLIR